MFPEGRKNFLLGDYGGQWHGADLELWDRCRYVKIKKRFLGQG